MSSTIGNSIKVTLFGESHGEAVGVVIDSLPAGEPIDLGELEAFLARRAPGGRYASQRKERDIPHILSGLVDGVTCGSPLCAVFENGDTQSQEYLKNRFLPRPGHGDYPNFIRHEGYSDVRGGGHSSARLTAPLALAGGIAKQLLARRGIQVQARLLSVGGVKDIPLDPVRPDCQALQAASEREIPALTQEAAGRMAALIEEVRMEGDSIGGVVECCVTGLPAGLGAPIFDGVENEISRMVFGIPAVRGIQFGAGFDAAGMRGSQHNDPFCIDETGEVRTETNRHGGVLGGMTSGMPLLFQAAFKPTPSIAMEQKTVDLLTRTETTIQIKGRHDPCVALRAVPCVEAAAALAILSLIG